MSLIQEINRTNTEKNKTKQVATNIDNKLVELGGERATDLNDVPNKMGVMIKDNYKKVAILQKKMTFDNSNLTPTPVKVPVNLSFKPSRILAHFTHNNTDDINEFTDTASNSKNPNQNTMDYNWYESGAHRVIAGRIKSWTASTITFEIWSDFASRNINYEIICIE